MRGAGNRQDRRRTEDTNRSQASDTENDHAENGQELGKAGRIDPHQRLGYICVLIGNRNQSVAVSHWLTLLRWPVGGIEFGQKRHVTEILQIGEGWKRRPLRSGDDMNGILRFKSLAVGQIPFVYGGDIF
jgi:hypothetical protein